MIADLLDLLTPAQMFHLLNYLSQHRLTPTRANVKAWMRSQGFRAVDIGS